MSRIVLHIDRLVLRGIEPGDATAFSEALQAELHRRLHAGGIQALSQQDRQARYRPAPLHLAPHTSSDAFGRAVAERMLPVTERGGS
jgi:hypothetical protein